jgi:hypothetical protein
MAITKIIIFGKKGIFFSLLSVFILLAFLILFSSLFEPQTFLVQQDVEDELVLLSNNQLSFFKETYLENAIKLSSRVALISYIDEINDNGFPIDCQDDGCVDDSEELAQLSTELVNFVAIGNSVGLIANPKEGRFVLPEYQNLTLLSQLNEVRKMYRDHFQVDLNFLDKNGDMWPVNSETDDFDVNQAFVDDNLFDKMSVGQIRPYTMQVNLTIGFNYSAKSNSIRWIYNDLTIVTEVPINGLIDPIYMYYSENLFPGYQFNNTFREHIIYDMSDKNTVLTLYNTSHYMSSPDVAPSFIQRLVNSDKSSHCCGISSIVNFYELFGGTIGVAEEAKMLSLSPAWYTRSSIDYLFFYAKQTFVCEESSDGSLQLHWLHDVERVGSGPSFFTIDKQHVTRFNIAPTFYDDETIAGVDDELTEYCFQSDACDNTVDPTCP